MDDPHDWSDVDLEHPDSDTSLSPLSDAPTCKIALWNVTPCCIVINYAIIYLCVLIPLLFCSVFFYVPFYPLFFSGVPQRLDAGDLGGPTRYCYLESIYHAWDGGTDHRASLVSHPSRSAVAMRAKARSS